MLTKRKTFHNNAPGM